MSASNATKAPLPLPSPAKRGDPRLRAEAGIYYMTHDTPTLEEMSQDPRFSNVTLKTLERWSKDDQWVERRAAFFQAWKQRANQRLGTELCRLRQRDLADLETVRSLALEKLNDGLLEPKSWEGVAKILLDATEHRDRIAAAIGNELMPGQSEQKQLRPEDVGATSEELKIAAREILRHRREATQLTLVNPNVAPTLAPLPPAAPVMMPNPITIDEAGTILSIGTGAEDEGVDEDADKAVFEDDEDFEDD
jgi:hypothetical protein